MIDLLQVPYDSGYRGTRMGAGPLRLVQAGLLECVQTLSREARLVPIELESPFPTEIAAAFALARTLRGSVQRSLREDRLPVVLAGNCMSALGTVAALGRPAVFWFDAHPDLNTPESTHSGFLDGMALSVLLGRCWTHLARDAGLAPLPAAHVELIGTRDLDPPEREFLAHSSLRWPGAATRNAPPPGLRDAYLHVDLDVLDPSVGAANQFATPGGLTLDQLLEAISAIATRHRIAALALTAYDPAYDPGGAIVRAACRIVEHAARLRAPAPGPQSRT